ncbi:MAG: RNA-binding protein [Thermoprotei archaeon]|nr:MAG: RNA-binding protein [Thermoprotei archaeon]
MFEMVKEAWHGRAVVHIGKKGITEEVIEEIKRQLEERKVVKVRILRSCLEVENRDRREIARRIAELTGAKLAGIRGHVFVLYKARRSRQ